MRHIPIAAAGHLGLESFAEPYGGHYQGLQLKGRVGCSVGCERTEMGQMSSLLSLCHPPLGTARPNCTMRPFALVFQTFTRLLSWFFFH